MAAPNIKTAVPKRRYQYGEFVITVLGEIDSDDAAEYRWILAVAQEGAPAPGLFITSERNRGAGGYDLRVAMQDGSQVIETSDAWGDQELFVREALGIVSSMLELGDEMPHRLM